MPPTVLTSDDREAVASALASEPRFTDPQTIALYNWVVRLVTALFNYVTYFIGDNSDRTDSLQQKVQDLEARIAQLTSQPTPTPHQSSTASRSTRCQRCHAIGHGTNDCRTKDPVLNKKRVANNRKAKKEAEQRTYMPQPPLPRSYSSPPRYYHDVTPELPIRPEYPAFTALVADAKELRRRKVQSTRDKRRKGAPTTST